jgi:hypothetical protein
VGKLIYGNGQVFDFDDRALIHLQLVCGAKLRRGEAFYFSFTVEDVVQSIWMHPAIPAQFTISTTDSIPVNRDWLEAMTVDANSPRGLHLIREPIKVDN